MAESAEHAVSLPGASDQISDLELPAWVQGLVESLTSPVIYMTLDPEVRVLYINPAGRRLLDLSKSLGPSEHTYSQLSLQTDINLLSEAALTALRQRKVWQDTAEVSDPRTGKTTTLDRRVYPISSSTDGTVGAACVIANDVSQQLSDQRTSEILQRVLDHVPAAVTVFAPDTKLEVLYANPTSLEYNGVENIEALTRKFVTRSFDQAQLQQFLFEIVPRVLKGERVESEALIHNAKTNASIKVQRIVFPVYAQENEPIVAIGAISTNVENITVRVDRAETKLAEQDVLMGAVQRMYGGEKRRAEYLAQVQVIASHAASRTDMSEMLSYAAKAMREAFKYYVVAIHIVDPITDQLVMRAVDGAGGPQVRTRTRRPVDTTRSAASWVASSGEELLIEHTETERYQPIEGWPDTRSQLLVPVIYAERIVGVLDLHGNRPQQFDEIDRSAARIIAGQIATSIEIARLFEEAREQTLLEERNRLAREMHDSLIQKLASVHWQISALKMETESSDIPTDELERIESISTLIQETLDEARRSVWNLGANELEGKSLSEALESLVSRISRDRGLVGTFNMVGSDTRKLPDIESALLRITQEAINNVAAHSNASSFDVTLSIDSTNLVLAIADDGDGFDMSELPEPTRESGYGLVSMNQRAGLIGGVLTISSAPGAGTRVTLTVPVPPLAEKAPSDE